MSVRICKKKYNKEDDIKKDNGTFMSNTNC